MNNNILDQILKNTYTVDRLKKRVKALKTALTEEYFGGGDETNLNLDKQEKEWLKSLPADFLKNFNKDDFNEIFSSLESQISSLKPLTVYLAFEPEEKELSEIAGFVRTNFLKNLLLDVKLDPSLIGGCALIWNGIYKDYSLRARLEGNKEQILGEFKQFLKQ